MAVPGPATASMRVDPAFVVGPLNRRLFGSFVEHLGRCVYTGIYDPDHPTADDHGFRGDVAELITELGPTIIRYPGGNFVSAYDWRDGVGPREQRPVRYDLAWNTVETNQVGTDEFLRWCARLGLEPMLAVNLGTAGVRETSDLLQYVNARTGIAWADERAANGHPDPYGVTVWCLGNEMDGPWQIGYKTPEEYGRLAAEAGRAMKRFDPALELVACGSSNRQMPSFATWERVVLERCFDQVDHISAHAYYEPVGDDHASFLASAEDMDRFISAVVATADHVAAARKSDKRITISFDEWNVWFAERAAGAAKDLRAGEDLAFEVYDVQDAVVVGSLLIELLRHTDRVAIACQAQLVNVLAPILTRPAGTAWRQTIFHPFALTARHAKPTVLSAAMCGPQIRTQRYGLVDQLHGVATVDRSSGEVVIFAANRSRTDALDLRLELAGFDHRSWVLAEHTMITDENPHARNTATDPERIVPLTGDARIVENEIRALLPAVSWHCLRLLPN